MKELKLVPVDTTPIHNDLIEQLSDFLYWLPVGPRKHRDITCGRQAIGVICLLNNVLNKHGYKIVKEKNERI